MNSLQTISHSHSVPVAHDSFRAYEPRRPQLRQWLGLIFGRLPLGLGVAGAVFLAVLLLFAQQTPTYTASGSVLVQPRENLAEAQQSTAAGLPADTSAIDTQVEVLRSTALAQATVQKLKLFQDPEFNSELRGGWFGGKPAAPQTADADTLARVTEAFQSRLHVRRAGLTYVVNVGFSSEDPRKAARIVNGFIATYLERQLDQKVAAVTRANKELGAQVESLRREAQEAEARVQDYKNANGLYSAAGATMAEQEVSTLNQQIAAAKADTAEKRARLNAALAQVSRGGGGGDVGAALGSDTIKELRTQEAAASLKLAQLKADFKDDYPEVRRTQAQLNDIRGQIQAEINRILSSLRAEAAAAAQREGSLLASRGTAQGGIMANNRAQAGLFVLQQRADAAKTIYEGYLNRAKEVAVEGSLQQSDATVNSPAVVPTRPSSPDLRIGFALATLLALIAGVLAMVLAELWNSVLRSGQDVERDLGVRFAGVLPDAASVAPKHLKKANPSDYLVDQPLSGFAEAFRNLRAFLMLADRSGPARTIAVTSAIPGEGKSLTSLCLARTLALSGARVAVVDCDLRRKGLSKLVPSAERGLIEVVNGEPLQGAMVHDPRSGAWILSAGGGDVPGDLFSRADADRVFDELAQSYDYVILDTPPVLGVADSRVLAAKADRVIYLVRWNKTPVRAAQSAIQILRESGANLAGAVLSKVNVGQQARFGYGDSSDYFNYYHDYYLTHSPAR